jgi:hypothetical protein
MIFRGQSEEKYTILTKHGNGLWNQISTSRKSPAATQAAGQMCHLSRASKSWYYLLANPLHEGKDFHH